MTDLDLDKEQLTDSDEEVKERSMYRVFILNDNYTPMDFVVLVLLEIFNKSREQAEAIMFTAHKEGQALVGVYSHDVAETKVSMVDSVSKEAGFPLKAIMEEE